jgi:WhiB family redox-sensing transcriptional regulator
MTSTKPCEACGRLFGPGAQQLRACSRECGHKIRVAKGPTRPKLSSILMLDFLLGEEEPACADADPDLFFPEPGAGGSAAAKAICARCPVQAPCEAWARAQSGALDGIWGGTTWRERNRSGRR